MRDELVKLRMALKDKTDNILNSNGIINMKEMFSSEKFLKKVLELDLEQAELFELRLVEHIIHRNKIIEELKG